MSATRRPLGSTTRRLQLGGMAAALVLWLLLPELLPARLSVLVVIALYVPVVVGLSMLSGFAGQVSIGHAAFYGVGAYAVAILTVTHGWPPLLALPAAVVVTAVIAYVVGLPVLMLRGHYLVFATFGLNVILFVLFREWRSLTGGSFGITGVPPIAVGSYEVTGDLAFFWLGTALSVAALAGSRALVRSRFGGALQAIESNEMAATTLGVSSTRYKTQVFVWSAALAGASGALYAHWLTFVSPTPFAPEFSVTLLVMAVVGGVASLPGAVVGTVLIVVVREVLRELVPSVFGVTGEYEILFFGALLATVVIFLPGGLWSGVERVARRVWRGGRAEAPDPVAPEPAPEPAAGGDVLRVDGLTKRFGGLTAVDGLSFSVAPREIVGVIGPNGAGKSTLLNLVSGVLAPTSGSVTIAGERCDGVPAHRVARLGVARSFQTPSLFGLLDVLGNATTGRERQLRSGFLRSLLRLNRAEERDAASRAMGALELVGSTGEATRNVTALPFASRRHVELARSLGAAPRLMLLDEPASGLSGAERTALRSTIRSIRDRGTAIVLVDHDVPLVMDLADRIVVMHHGEKIGEGPPEVVRQDQRVIDAYLGSATGATASTEPAPARVAAAADGRAPVLRATGISAGYGAVPVLKDVHVEARAGEIVTILGSNGAGKTTLMRALTGLIPARGRIELDGRPVAGMSPDRLARAGLCLVPEHRELLWTMTVAEHLELGAYPAAGRGGRQGGGLALVEELFPEIVARPTATARSLSGGQQQMLAIARALMAEPRILLLDEPLLGLAPQVIELILAKMERLRDEGVTLVVVEQNAGAALSVADRGYVLAGGEVVLAGSAEELAGSDDLERAVIGNRPPEPGTGDDGAGLPATARPLAATETTS